MIRSITRVFAAVLLTAGFASFASASSIESEIELLRSDLKADKVEIVKEALKLDAAKSDAFWPVYRKYQLELDKIGDKRLAMIKDYAAAYDSMTDAKAKTLVKTALDLQAQRNSLMKKSFGDFEKVLGTIDAAKLLQVENLVQALLDVQMAADLPLVEKPAAAK
jgi:putative lipoic acid-binding regulatory protein